MLFNLINCKIFPNNIHFNDYLHIFNDILIHLRYINNPKYQPMESFKNKFENSEITVTFSPQKCIHSEKCAQGLSEVFKTAVIPWIDLDGAKSSKIISQIKKCPSGALKFSYNHELAF